MFFNKWVKDDDDEEDKIVEKILGRKEEIRNLKNRIKTIKEKIKEDFLN